MNKKIVRRDVDLANPPPLTEKQRSELAALAAKSDRDIDYSDIPPQTKKFWNDAVRGRFYKPTKTSKTVRIDSDVLAWLQAPGKGYQTRMNAILRREMASSTAEEMEDANQRNRDPEKFRRIADPKRESTIGVKRTPERGRAIAEARPRSRKTA
jgi:uncharacterized protein (DUF4415 family)